MNGLEIIHSIHPKEKTKVVAEGERGWGVLLSRGLLGVASAAQYFRVEMHFV
jgi:hypothetical protein